MANPLLTVQKFNAQPAEDAEQPVFLTGWQLRLADHERIVWQGSASAVGCTREVNGAWKAIARLKAKSKLLITDRRIVYISRKYKTGWMWFGGPIAIPLTLGGKLITALFRQGKAAVGQVRFEFPTAIFAKNVKVGFITDNELSVIGYDELGKFQVTFDVSSENIETIAADLARGVARYRSIPNPEPVTKHESRTTTIAYTLPKA